MNTTRRGIPSEIACDFGEGSQAIQSYDQNGNPIPPPRRTSTRNHHHLGEHNCDLPPPYSRLPPVAVNYATTLPAVPDNFTRPTALGPPPLRPSFPAPRYYPSSSSSGATDTSASFSRTQQKSEGSGHSTLSNPATSGRSS